MTASGSAMLESVGPLKSWPCLHELFESHARRTPHAIAVRCGNEVCTYGQLDLLASSVAGRLVAAGATRGDLIGVNMHNGVRFAAAVLGTWKAGCALLPLDVRIPAPRLCAIIDESRPRLVITTPALTINLAAAHNTQFLDIEALCVETNGVPVVVGPNDVAYVMYTSGSTGRPKGVKVAHIGVASHLLWLHEEMPLPVGSAILFKSSHSFDAWLLEFLWGLTGGHSLIMAESHRATEPPYLLELMRIHAVAGVVAVPSILKRLVASDVYLQVESLRYVISAGETLDAALATTVLSKPGVTLYNLYGPTEASIDVTYHRVDPAQLQDPIPIGKPLPHNTIQLLDEHCRPVPVGGRGEIYIGGLAVGLGYLGSHADSPARFLSGIDGVAKDVKWFRTGDHAYLNVDGALVFLGREDNQVKLNGVRIEPAEVEAVLRAHPSIMDCAVAVKTLRNERRALVAYLLPRGCPASAGELITFLRKQLPGYMVPVAYVIVEELPSLPNGKRDYASLQIPRDLPRNPLVEYQTPRTDLEQQLVALWEKHLGVTPIGVYDSFYVLGGSSLASLDLLVTISEQIDARIFEYGFVELPCISELARIIETGKSALVSL